MAPHLSPFVYWAQSEKDVFLKVDLKDVKCSKVNLEKRRLEFEGNGLGAKGVHNYEFVLDFHSGVDPEDSNYKVLDNKVDFHIAKCEKGWWPRLTCQPQKPAWLKVDFDRWQSEEDVNDEEEVRDIREDYPDLYTQLQNEEFGYKKEDLRKVYLIIYNLLMFVGFFYVCCVLGVRWLRDGTKSFPGTYEVAGSAMRFIQLLQFLEVMHPLFGYTKGGVFAPLMQVGGRSIILFALIEAEPRMQTKPIVFYLFIVWSLIEIVRYPFYITKLYKKNITLLTWLRYTMWIPLYPVGFFCEGVILLRSIPYAEETERFTVSMPNSLNFTFHFPSFLRICLLLVILPVMYVLMTHMYKMRRAKLGARKWQKSN